MPVLGISVPFFICVDLLDQRHLYSFYFIHQYFFYFYQC